MCEFVVNLISASELKNGSKSPAVTRPAAPPPSPPAAEKFDQRLPLQQQRLAWTDLTNIA